MVGEMGGRAERSIITSTGDYGIMIAELKVTAMCVLNDTYVETNCSQAFLSTSTPQE